MGGGRGVGTYVSLEHVGEEPTDLIAQIREAARADDEFTRTELERSHRVVRGETWHYVRINVHADHSDVLEGGPIHRKRQETAVNAAYAVLTRALRKQQGLAP